MALASPGSTTPASRLAPALASMALGGLAVTAYAVAETRRFVLREATMPVLPAGHGPLRVLHLSDLHLTPRQRRKRAWVRELGGLRPDLVVNSEASDARSPPTIAKR